MDITIGFLLFTLLATHCNALATLEGPEDDLSPYFEDIEISRRMFGGYEAGIGSHPHMVALTVRTKVKTAITCGGSLISHQTILSAAHCVGDIKDPVNSMFAIVGTNRWYTGGTTYAFSGILLHPEFRRTLIPNVNDISLFFTINYVVFTERVQPIPLSFDYVPAAVTCKVAGWGWLSLDQNSGMSASRTLMELTTTTICEQDCFYLWDAILAKHNERPFNTKTEMCTLNAPGRGFCYGDSGSALIRADTGEQIGIVSWTKICAQGFPDVYVRISAYEDWIRANAI